MNRHSLIEPFTSNAAAIAAHDMAKSGRNPLDWQWFRIRVLYSDFTDSDTSQSLDLEALADTLVAAGSPRVTGPIPNSTDSVYIMAGNWAVDLVQVFAGGTVSAATVILGRSGDDNAYLTQSNVFTGATLTWLNTPSAADYAPRVFGALVPLLQLDTTTDNIDNLESGIVDVYFQWCVMPRRQAA